MASYRFKTERQLSTGVIVTVLILTLLAFIGWVMNIVELFGMSFSTVTGELVVRIIGVFLFPIGGIAGWF